MIKELENKIGQLQYEISLLGLDQEDLTGVTIRTDELKDLVKNLSLYSVSQQRELLSCDCPKCSKEMISEWVKHHHCNKCKEHYTST